MSWLVASAERTEVGADRTRELRRLNAPVQLAVAAAHDVAVHARAPAELALVSLAPCHQGSPELDRWIELFATGASCRVNPTHTLHAVDNLALSVISIALGARGWAMSLGGAPGMLWTALELVGERDEPEVLVLAGDQDAPDKPASAIGVALLFARERPASGPAIRLISVERRRAETPAAHTPHAAAGARALLAALGAQPAGRFSYVVPAAHGDGVDDIALAWELG
jgi:hypothetical protein